MEAAETVKTVLAPPRFRPRLAIPTSIGGPVGNAKTTVADVQAQKGTSPRFSKPLLGAKVRQVLDKKPNARNHTA
jgi:hypothetical protein